MELLYHYTSFDGFKKIITSSALLCNNLSKVSDKLELENKISILESSIDNSTRARIERIFRVDLLELANNICSNHYVACFSKNASNNYLWDQYKDTEVVLAFDKKYFPKDGTNQMSTITKAIKENEVLTYPTNPYPADPYKLVQSLYSKEILLENINNALMNYNSANPATEHNLIHSFNRLFISYKDEEYKKEDEIRLVFYDKENKVKNKSGTISRYNDGTAGNFGIPFFVTKDELFYSLIHRHREGIQTVESHSLVEIILRNDINEKDITEIKDLLVKNQFNNVKISFRQD